ncbi:hypothetical protein EHQ76_10650 [Leptospira barantonii]|uniref:Uncharacterized protein n=1 Tax=Leptospira barantonii TaxID=2023184 RepID=A0A5F2B6I1_9LEPT|nr:hypothetical protein [Leptospira barantonii]TGM01092.1 hypothetical protein EHQ76_10650 [Leptospira barantonii]
MKTRYAILQLLIFIHCFNFGFDTADVMRATDANRKIITTFGYKFQECRSQGNNYTSLVSPNGYPSVTYCNSDTIKENEGNYVWKKAVDSCLNLIQFIYCPENGSNFDSWASFVYSACNISEAYFINDYKPLQGKILFVPRTMSSLSFGCL